MFFDKNSVEVAGNVVRTNGVYATKSKKQFAFVTLASHAEGSNGKHTTFVECIAWNKLAEQVADLSKGQKIMVKAHLGNGFDTTQQHGDKVQTLVPVVNSVKVLKYTKKSQKKSASKDSKKSSAKTTAKGKQSKKTAKKPVASK